ncbi:MAG: hypothetical protein JSS14_28860 [Proteobacteria bacterium]|nr:hypothetical protein [Pseudomonadota bacterium]
MSTRGRLFLAYWAENGAAAAVRLVARKVGNALTGRRVFNSPNPALKTDRPATVGEYAHWAFPAVRPLPVYVIPASSALRISLVTDSVGSGSLFGGVGTALLFAAQLANRTGASLRVVTRTEAPMPKNVHQVLAAYGVDLTHEVQFAYAPPDKKSGAPAGLDLYPNELVITTSWWTTAAALPSVPNESIIYLLQEDERMFYSFGEERLRCEEVLSNRSIRFVINTRLLYDHLIASGLENIRARGQWFEPAFPSELFHKRKRATGEKRRLFFYARPNNPRNLFGTGLRLLERAVNEGILDLEHWDVYLVGSNIPNVAFGLGYLPKRAQGLDWKAYADLMGTIDLGVSLMYTPHPSYPPLDLAASGAVVVTNKFANKQSLESYSRNIICADLQMDSLLDALKSGIKLAEDGETRDQNYRTNGLGGDWAASFEPIFQSMTSAR